MNYRSNITIIVHVILKDKIMLNTKVDTVNLN